MACNWTPPQTQIRFAEPELEVLKRIGSDQGVIDVMKRKMHPGMALVLTDMPADPRTRSSHDFVIATTDL